MANNNPGQQQESSYVRSLKQIKQLEEKVQAEIEEHRKKVNQEMKKLDDDLVMAIEAATAEGEKMLAESVEKAQKKASLEADKVIEEAHKKAKSISGHMDIPPTLVNKLTDIMLSGL